MKGFPYARLRGSDFTLKVEATFRAKQWPHQMCIFKRQLCRECQRRDRRAVRPEVGIVISVKNQKYSPERGKRLPVWHSSQSEV